MTLKRMFMFLIAAMFVLPLFLVAEDDFEDDEFGSFEDEEKTEPFDAEESAAKKKAEDKEQSDAAMRDLLGDEESKEDKDDEAAKEEKKADKKKKKKNDEPVKEKPKKVKEPVQKGLKPVILVKGGFTLLGNYREKSATDGKITTKGSMFGSVDEGLLGAEFIGDHVIAKGTMNVRTDNPLVNKGNNPLAKINLHSIQNGVDNALYEIYGGIRFFDIFVKAGKMIPEYGLMDMYQNLGMGFSTPFLTRSLVAVEGFIPETDAGISFGYKGTFADKHTILAGLMLGTGSIASDFWNTDKTMGIYGRLGYMHEYFQVAFGIQYKMDYYFKTVVKKPTFTGIGIHLNVSPKIGSHEISAPITFDYNLFGLIKSGTQQKSVNGILLSAAPGYAYCFDSEWADKIALAVRFDLVKGVYKNGATDYLDYDKYSLDGVVFRIGATLNFFAKEMANVHSYAGLTFLVQPESKIVGKTLSTASETDYGFMTLMLSAGAEM